MPLTCAQHQDSMHSRPDGAGAAELAAAYVCQANAFTLGLPNLLWQTHYDFEA